MKAEELLANADIDFEDYGDEYYDEEDDQN